MRDVRAKTIGKLLVARGLLAQRVSTPISRADADFIRSAANAAEFAIGPPR